MRVGHFSVKDQSGPVQSPRSIFYKYPEHPMVFDFEHLFSFHKRSIRDWAYITSFLAKPLSRCSVVYPRIQESGSLRWTSVTCVVTDRFRVPSAWLFSFSSVCSLRAYAHVRSSLRSQLRNAGVLSQQHLKYATTDGFPVQDHSLYGNR